MESDHFEPESARLGEFRRRVARNVQCRSCGYEPGRHSVPDHCPKCGGGCWERFVRVARLRSDPPASRLRPPARMAPPPYMEVDLARAAS